MPPRKPVAGADSVKSALYAQLARVALALGSPGRLQFLEYVPQGERRVETVASMRRLSEWLSAHPEYRPELAGRS